MVNIQDLGELRLLELALRSSFNFFDAKSK